MEYTKKKRLGKRNRVCTDMLYEQAIVGAFPLSSVVLASLSRHHYKPLNYARGVTWFGFNVPKRKYFLVDNLFPQPVSTDFSPLSFLFFPAFSLVLFVFTKYWSACLFISEENDPESPSKSLTATIVAVVVVLVILLIVVVAIIVWRRRSPRNGMFWSILI